MIHALFVDQSTTTCGYAAIRLGTADVRLKVATVDLLGHGRITTPPRAGLVGRINIIAADITHLLERYQINELVVEDTQHLNTQYQGTHGSQAVLYKLRELAEARGIPLYKLHPSTIKKQMTGSGKASKDEVQLAVELAWEMEPKHIKDNNHADALAGAWVWSHLAKERRIAGAVKI